MQGYKKLNLLPLAVRNKYANKYLLYAASLVCGICILALAIQYINIGILSYNIKRIGKENAKYNEEKAKIESLTNMIQDQKAFLTEHEYGGFPFSSFMRDIELYRPITVSILSVDSRDRLVNQGENAEPSDKTKAEEETDTAAEVKTEEADTPKPDEVNIEYTKDLAGEEIVIRGYGQNSEDISRFIYDISRLGYIVSAKITAIEQHTLNNAAESIFEITVIGGAVQ